MLLKHKNVQLQYNVCTVQTLRKEWTTNFMYRKHLHKNNLPMYIKWCRGSNESASMISTINSCNIGKKFVIFCRVYLYERSHMEMDIQLNERTRSSKAFLYIFRINVEGEKECKLCRLYSACVSAGNIFSLSLSMFQFWFKGNRIKT